MELLIGINLDNAAMNDEVEEQHVLTARGVAYGLTKVIDEINGLTWTDTQERLAGVLLFGAGTMSVPCPTCPWRRSSTVGGADIPHFDIELMRGLSNTVGPDDAFRPIMACHGSPCGLETPCVGYVAVEGWSNLAVRLNVMSGRIDMSAIDDACRDLDLWSSFHEMLEAYEEAQ